MKASAIAFVAASVVALLAANSTVVALITYFNTKAVTRDTALVMKREEAAMLQPITDLQVQINRLSQDLNATQSQLNGVLASRNIATMNDMQTQISQLTKELNITQSQLRDMEDINLSTSKDINFSTKGVAGKQLDIRNL